jgi:fructokinase
MTKKVLCFGEVLWDAFGDGKKAGGAPMNVAMHLMQQGIDTTMATSLGSDPSGDELLEFLNKNNLNTQLVQRDEELPTCEVTVYLDEHNHASYRIPEPVSWDRIRKTSSLTQVSKEVDALVFGSLACRQKVSRNTLSTLLNETPAMKVFDVNLRPPHFELSTIQTLAAKANVVKMNEEEAELLIGGSNGDLKINIIEFQKKYHTQTICVTRGEKGAIIWHNDAFYEHVGVPVTVADTVGAGDSFLATLITGVLYKKPMQQVLEKACRVGAFVASQRGANPTYPPELLTFQSS